MSGLLDTATPVVSETQPAEASPAQRVDLFALTRALVFTKEAYRTLKAKVRGRRNEMMRLTPDDEGAAIEPAVTFIAAPLAMTRDKALTPWDLMDDEENDAGVTFAEFQQRRPLERQRRRAA
jgi:hypothetical protein